MLRAVLLDYGQTLVTFGFPRAGLLEMLEKARGWIGGDVPPAGDLLDRVLLPLERDLDACGEDEVDYLELLDRAWRHAGLELPRPVLERVLEAEQEVWSREAKVDPEAIPVLRALRERGLRTVVASNAPFPPALMHRQLERHGLAAVLDGAVFSSEVGRRKPAADLYLAAARLAGVRPEEALYVGDRVREDWEGPRAAGMRALLCVRHSTDPGAREVDHVASLAGVLERL